MAKRLHFGGHQTILIQQVFKPTEMLRKLHQAINYFDYILLPCQPEEIEFHYKEHDELWMLLQHESIQAIGPIARTSQLSDDKEKVIFTLGGGGQHGKEKQEYSIQALIGHYVEAAHILSEAGKKNLYLAKGPLMKVLPDLGPLIPLETMQLPDHFGPNTRVVTRGTYNLGWETIATGSTLITTERSGTSFEYTNSRNAYLAEKGYAYNAEMNGPALAEIILRDPPPHLAEGKALIDNQLGLKTIASILSQPL